MHSRLRIIDLDPRANQPMQRGRLHIVYNGEIYNYRELRNELGDRDDAFSTSSDTEVLLAQIAAKGIDNALKACEGMWAFAVYDAETGCLSLARDRFGEKPLYIMQSPDGVYFASEPKYLFALSGRQPEVNIDQLSRYLVNGYKALYKNRAQFFSGLREVPSGTIIEIGRNSITERRYWSPVGSPDPSLTFAQSVENVRGKLIRAVELRLRADVPLAFCLSGGIDSNAIIAIAKRVFDYDVHGFTIVNSDARYEEQAMVDVAVSELALRHTAIPLTTDHFLDNLRLLVRQHDAPVYTISYYVHWLLMKSVAQAGYRVSISGTAADELFSGYYDHHNAYLQHLSSNPSAYAAAKEMWLQHVAPIVRNPFLQNPDLFIQDPQFRGHIYLNSDVFSSYLKNAWSEPFAETIYCNDLLRNRMLNELFHESVPVILHEDDSNAMYYSIENRSPFLDRQLFEQAMAVPTRHLIREGRTKAVLREAVRGIVPDAILDNRRKVGFNAPIEDLLDTRSPAVREAVLDRSPIYDLVRRDAVESLMSRDRLPNSESKFLFNVLCSKIFLEEYSGSDYTAAPETMDRVSA